MSKTNLRKWFKIQDQFYKSHSKAQGLDFEYTIRSRRTKHKTLPYWVGLDCCQIRDNLKFSQTWDFRFDQISDAEKCAETFRHLIKEVA